MLSIFNIDLGDPKNVVYGDDIIPQIDTLLPRFTKFSDGSWMWLDNAVNQDSIVAKFDGTYVYEITIRFDTEKPSTDFKLNVIEFVKRNGFTLTIDQKIDFEYDKLTDDLIKLNQERHYRTDNPVHFITKQRN
jgi:hypothetical protein